MANKRVSELNELLYTQVASNDLFVISDVSAVESKKITAASLRQYASNTGSFSGSLYGTASHALNALTASHLLYTGIFNGSCSYAISASYALSASYADWAKTASFVISASYAKSSSWADSASWCFTASYALTSEVQLVVSSAFCDYATSASYLHWVPGRNTGTASYAFTSSHADRAITSSYLHYTAGSNTGTASYALNAKTASLSTSASFLVYNPTFPNGTASYALVAVDCDTSTIATTAYSVYHSYIYREFDTVTSSISGDETTASFGWLQWTSSGPVALKIDIEAWGDVVIPITNSYNESGSLQLLVEGPGAQVFSLDRGTFLYNFSTQSLLEGGTVKNTGSIVTSFYLKGKFVGYEPTLDGCRYSASVLAYNGLQFCTQSRDVQCCVKATTDYFLDE